MKKDRGEGLVPGVIWDVVRVDAVGGIGGEDPGNQVLALRREGDVRREGVVALDNATHETLGHDTRLGAVLHCQQKISVMKGTKCVWLRERERGSRSGGGMRSKINVERVMACDGEMK